MAGGAASPAIRGAQADLLIVVAYGALLPPEILSIAPHGALNLHFSLLPRWRGASPVQRAILAGDAVTGASVMRMEEGLDTGPVLASVETTIADDEDAGTLGARLAELGGALLISTLDDLAAGKAVAVPQDPAEATQAPKLTAAERVIDWSEGAVPIARRIRALAPAPGASTTFRGEPLKVVAARAALDHIPEDTRPIAERTNRGRGHRLDRRSWRHPDRVHGARVPRPAGGGAVRSAADAGVGLGPRSPFRPGGAPRLRRAASPGRRPDRTRGTTHGQGCGARGGAAGDRGGRLLQPHRAGSPHPVRARSP